MRCIKKSFHSSFWHHNNIICGLTGFEFWRKIQREVDKIKTILYFWGEKGRSSVCKNHHGKHFSFSSISIFRDLLLFYEFLLPGFHFLLMHVCLSGVVVYRWAAFILPLFYLEAVAKYIYIYIFIISMFPFETKPNWNNNKKTHFTWDICQLVAQQVAGCSQSNLQLFNTLVNPAHSCCWHCLTKVNTCPTHVSRPWFKV